MVFEFVLMELNKQNAPSIDLETFNYFFNKAINQFVNKQYNVGVDTDQQRTDDIRVLKSSTVLKPSKTPKDLSDIITNFLDKKDDDSGSKGNAAVINTDSIYGATYEFNLPADYLHLLNCICLYRVKKRINCPYNVGDIVRKGATKCNADTWPLIIDNLYMRPTYKRPYYYINNINTQNENPTNPLKADNGTGTSIKYTGVDVPTKQWEETGPKFVDSKKDALEKVSTTYRDNDGTGTSIKYTGVDVPTKEWEETGPKFVDDKDSLDKVNTTYRDSDGTGNKTATSIPVNRKLSIKIPSAEANSDDDLNVKTAGHRYGNSSNVRLEIRYGQDSSVFELIGIVIDYIKAPQFIRLTQEQLDLTEDTSQTLEFPDYICQEIINELVKLLMENASDPRIQTNPAVSQSIAAPAQAQAPQQSNKR